MYCNLSKYTFSRILTKILAVSIVFDSVAFHFWQQHLCANLLCFYGYRNENVDIYNVSGGTLNNSSDYSQTGGPVSILSRYSDYTTVVAAPVFNQLATIPFSVLIASGFHTHTAICVDYNRNGTFEAPGEHVFQTTERTFGAYTQTDSFTIPITALTGNTCMRVITSYGLDPLETA